MADTNGGGFIIQKEKDKPKNKCRKWELRISLGMDPRIGKYKTKSRRFNGTYAKAKVALREFVEEVEGDRVQGRTEYTLEKYSTCIVLSDTHARGTNPLECNATTTKGRRTWPTQPPSTPTSSGARPPTT